MSFEIIENKKHEVQTHFHGWITGLSQSRLSLVIYLKTFYCQQEPRSMHVKICVVYSLTDSYTVELFSQQNETTFGEDWRLIVKI